MATWDPFRFWQTLREFNVIPLIPRLGAPNITSHDLLCPKILVIGDLGHLSQRAIKQLWQKGYQPRWWVTPADESAARSLFPQGVEIVVSENLADAHLWLGITGVIYCPMVLESPGLKLLVELTNQYLPDCTDRQLFDFTQGRSELGTLWGAVDDVVMGGVSISGLKVLPDRAIFSGQVSTDNSGGFASIRTRNFSPPLDLSPYRGIALAVQGDGQRYKLLLRSSEQWDGLGYAYSFDTEAQGLTRIQIPFEALVPVLRAKTVSVKSPLDLEQIFSVQIMLSKFEYDGALNPRFWPGDFRLELFSIAAYGDRPLPQLVVLAPSTNTFGSPLEILAKSCKPYTLLQMGIAIDRPGGQGLDLSLHGAPNSSVSSEDLADLAVQILKIPAACGQKLTLREIGQRRANSWIELVEKAVKY
jgi:Complex I intermediate-associated protein 30 (CIA30)